MSVPPSPDAAAPPVAPPGPTATASRQGAGRAPHADKELPNLDVLRAIAVGLVLLDHVSETISPLVGISLHPWDWLLGRLGVLSFFVHTSLVLMQSLERARLSGGAMFLNFYVRRAFRIYPLSIACLVLVLALHVPRVPWEAAPPDWTTAQIVSNFLLIQNLTFSPSVVGPLWSLPYELQMYLVLPVLFWATRRWPALTVAGVGWIVAVVAGVVQPLIPGMSRLDLAQFGPCFLAGVLAFALMARVRAWLPSGAWLPSLLALIVAYVAIAGRLDMIHAPWLAWTYCLILGLAVPCFRQVVSRPGRVVAHEVARYSYGIYLGHVVALWVGFGGTGPRPLGLGSFWFVVSLAAFCVAGYHLIEKPFIDLGGRVSRGLCAALGARADRRAAEPAVVPGGAAMPADNSPL